MLGTMHQLGQGVIHDDVMAYMRYNIGAANGNELGGTGMDIIAEGMTPLDISKAQQMARDCMGSGYQNCGY
jgi:TPR repeat protein